jgi:hypothetical protein
MTMAMTMAMMTMTKNITLTMTITVSIATITTLTTLITTTTATTITITTTVIITITTTLVIVTIFNREHILVEAPCCMCFFSWLHLCVQLTILTSDGAGAAHLHWVSEKETDTHYQQKTLVLNWYEVEDLHPVHYSSKSYK